MSIRRLACLTMILFLPTVCLGIKSMTDTEIKEEIVKGSTNDFEGECPCPFSKDQAGKECGDKSAYFVYQSVNRPICFVDDITQDQVKAYRRKYNIPQLHDLNKVLNEE